MRQYAKARTGRLGSAAGAEPRRKRNAAPTSRGADNMFKKFWKLFDKVIAEYFHWETRTGDYADDEEENDDKD